jgi:DNA helicase HerA-like ATPase
VHHALRAFTPKDQKNVKGAAQTLRPNPAFDTVTAITGLRIGEALVSMLDIQGSPMPVERALIYPPHSRMTPLTSDERGEVIRSSPFFAAYMNVIDRESAYEQLKKKADMTTAEKKTDGPVKKPQRTSGSSAGDVVGSAAKSAAHAIGSQIGREIIRGVLGSLPTRRNKTSFTAGRNYFRFTRIREPLHSV